MIAPPPRSGGLGLLCLAACALGGLACSAAPPTAALAAKGAPLDYAARVRARISAAQGAPAYKLRHNPATCTCPRFEVLLDAHWHRVAFDAADDDAPTLLALQAAVSEAVANAEVPIFELQGTLDDALDTCGRGTLFITFRPTAFGPPPSEPPDEPPAEPDTGPPPE